MSALTEQTARLRRGNPAVLQGRSAHGATVRINASHKSNTGVAGITEQVYSDRRWRGAWHRYFVVTPHRSRFNIDTLGRDEAWRRALKLRAGHEAAVLAKGGAL